MLTLRPITADLATTFKAVRLRALHDSPSAFGSTFANESKLSDADWAARVGKWNDDVRAAAYLAFDDAGACGLVSTFLDGDETGVAHLCSMWVAPTHRTRGVGRLLVTAVLDWARDHGVRVVRLMVTSNNDAARRFYERLGFTPTGRCEPYPNDATLHEIEMSHALST